MSMMNSFQRFLSKCSSYRTIPVGRKYAFLIILIICALAVTLSIQINRWLPHYALSYSNVIAQQFQAKISFKTVHYRFPNGIIFKDVTISELNGTGSLLKTSQVAMGFSLSLFSSAASLNEILIDDMTVNYPALRNYWTVNDKKVLAQIKVLHQGKLHLLVNNGQFYLKGSANEEAIPFKIDFRLEGEHINAHGSWGKNSSLNLWGDWQGNSVTWKGFIFYDKFYILDIDGKLRILPNDILLKHLSFSIDGDDLGISGHCLRQSPFQCDADITYKRPSPHVNPQEPLKNISLHLHAENTLQKPSFKGSADLDLLADPTSLIPLHKVHLDFEKLNPLIINGTFLKIQIKKVQGTFSTQGNDYQIPLENILASLNFSEPYQKTIALSAQVFSGHAFSRIFLNTTSLPWQIKAHSSFKGITLYQGLLSGAFDLGTSETITLSGALALHHAHFNTTHFQKEMTKILQMPSLEDISGADLSCRFTIDGRSKMVDDLRLNTDDLDLRGDFHLDEDDLVKSQGSVRFSKTLLNESPIGRKIIGLVHGAWTLPFEFSLSGNMHRMNFQWDNSPLKDKVRQHLFSFFEEMIDRRMDRQAP